MVLIVVDTDILIDVARGDTTAIACLRCIEQQFQLATSAVTQMELIVGCRNKVELQELEKFLQRFQILKLTEQITDKAVNLLGQYRLSHGLLIADALIAATALEYDEAFITKNQSDYRFIPSLKLQPYP
ncbi:MAG: type II toxin-antitoxin system VapC family toxin [Pseudanabaena sp. RU_4_16]|nr:type II toxin-antitoxin system VapC family toxin [Pseudanabaena sp. SU_2_4]NJM27090.1 type II toxin-antitoxin system VapC family toxin [Pseudanabaena sp. RU_4_16]